MQVSLTISHMLVRITGVLLLLLGLLIWTEPNAGQFVPIHMLLGVVLVISVWVMSGVSLRAGAPVGFAGGLAVLGLLVLWLGLQQRSLMPGSSHWVIQVIHLLLGLAAVGVAEALGGRLRRARLASSVG